MKGYLVHTKPFVLESDSTWKVIGTRNMERSNLIGHLPAALSGVGDDQIVSSEYCRPEEYLASYLIQT
jgi:hypothetical protein